MESNVVKMNYLDRVNEGKCIYKGPEWFEFILSVISDVIKDNSLSQSDTKDILTQLSEEIPNP